MRTIVLKAAPDIDFYVGWSNEFEMPVWWGSGELALTYLLEDAAEPFGDKTDQQARLDRADANGTSAVGGFGFFGRWDDEGLIYEQRGILPRKHLVAACEALARNDEAAVWDLLEPFEDLGVVRRG